MPVCMVRCTEVYGMDAVAFVGVTQLHILKADPVSQVSHVSHWLMRH